MSRERTAIAHRTYWNEVKEHLASLVEQDPAAVIALTMSFLQSCPPEEIQAVKKFLGIEEPEANRAEKVDGVVEHAAPIGFGALSALQIASFLLALKGIHIPIAFADTDYATYVILCTLHISALILRIDELKKSIADMEKSTDVAADQAELEKNREILANLEKQRVKLEKLKASQTISFAMLSAIVLGASAFIITSPDTHLLSAVASLHSAGPANVLLGSIFAGVMTTMAVHEYKAATAVDARVKKLEGKLEGAIKDYDYIETKKLDPSDNILELKKERINALTNLLYAEKAKAAAHKTSAALWLSSALAIGGSTSFAAAVLIMTAVGATVAGGVVTMGAVPLAFGAICAAIAIYRWYRGVYAAKADMVKKPDDTPISLKQATAEAKRTSNWAGLFNRAPVVSAAIKPIDHQASLVILRRLSPTRS